MPNTFVEHPVADVMNALYDKIESGKVSTSGLNRLLAEGEYDDETGLWSTTAYLYDEDGEVTNEGIPINAVIISPAWTEALSNVLAALEAKIG